MNTNSPHKIGIARRAGSKWSGGLLTIACLISGARVAAQTPPRPRTPDALHQLNDSIEALVQRVSPSEATEDRLTWLLGVSGRSVQV
jgi:hypothetical protein